MYVSGQKFTLPQEYGIETNMRLFTDDVSYSTIIFPYPELFIYFFF